MSGLRRDGVCGVRPRRLFTHDRGLQVATSLYTELALDALQMGIWQRQRAGQDLAGLVHHSDRGVQYRAIRYTQRLAEAEAVASVGSKGDSYDNAMAEALNSLYKAELVRGPKRRRVGPWRGIDDLEIATAEWVDWSQPATAPRRAGPYSARRVRGRLLGHPRHRGARSRGARLRC